MNSSTGVVSGNPVTPGSYEVLITVNANFTEQAATGLRRILASTGIGPLERAKMLPTQLVTSPS